MRFSLILSLLISSLLIAGCNDDHDDKKSQKANLSLEITDISFEERDGRQQFNHTRHFRENNGVDVEITRGKICVESRQTCVDAFVKYEVEGGSSLVQENHHVATRQGMDVITFEYWATDENGNELMLTKSMEVDGQKARVLK